MVEAYFEKKKFWCSVRCKDLILVFGKSGQVAQELQALNDIFALDRSQADLKNPKTCVNAINEFKPSAVINAAAYTAVEKAEEEETLANIINGDAPAEMAKACAKLNIPFIHISTDYVFDGSGIKAWQPTDTAIPQNAYGRSKLLGEEAISASGATFVTLRTSWIISAIGNNFIKTMLKLSENRTSIKVIADQIGGPTPAQDIAQACVEITSQLLKDPTKRGIYHFSGHPNVSWYNLANKIFNKANINIAVDPISASEYPSLAKRPKNSRLNCYKTDTMFNIPRPKWNEGLENILTKLGRI